MQPKKVLVIFESTLPKKAQGWWRRFDIAIAPSALEPDIRARGLAFESLEDLTDPGSVQEAAAFLGELAHTTLADDTRIAKSIVYRGYELWWMHYDELFLRLCLPYTQYRRLLERLKDASGIYLHYPPPAGLFSSFFEAYSKEYEIEGAPKSAPPLGIWLQAALTLLFLPWLMLKRPKVMVWTSDLFDPPRDHDFRMRFIYEELYKRRLSFVEFIRSMEPARVVLVHALKRRRPVVYSYAVLVVLSWVARLFGEKKPAPVPGDPDRTFKIFLASYYTRNIHGSVWAIRAFQLFLKCIGVRAAIIPAANSRNFNEVLACKLLGIPTVGILHGAASKSYVVYDFIPEFDGEKILSVDKYGLWSEWWKDYYLKNSRAYRPEQLYISGPMRPLQHADTVVAPPPGESIRVLLMSEQLAAPEEIVPYLLALMEAKDISLYIKFRSYRDGFEEWLKTHRPDILERIDPAKIMRGTTSEAVGRCDVVVGSHTTGVLESLLQLKPLVFFYTKKWGDYFELQSRCPQYSLYAENSAQLMNYIKKSKDTPQAVLKELQQMFFGDPYQNGSKWVVDEIEKLLQ